MIFSFNNKHENYILVLYLFVSHTSIPHKMYTSRIIQYRQLLPSIPDNTSVCPRHIPSSSQEIRSRVFPIQLQVCQFLCVEANKKSSQIKRCRCQQLSQMKKAFHHPRFRAIFTCAWQTQKREKIRPKFPRHYFFVHNFICPWRGIRHALQNSIMF